MKKSESDKADKKKLEALRRTSLKLVLRAGKLAKAGVLTRHVSYSDEENGQIWALIVVLNGAVPPECLADFQDLAARWGQDLHLHGRLLGKVHRRAKKKGGRRT